MRTIRRLDLYGHLVSIESQQPRMSAQIDLMLGLFAGAATPALGTATDTILSRCSGEILNFDEPNMLRHVSSKARLVGELCQFVELFEGDGKCWLVDERWGMCEIDVLRGHWRSWMLPKPTLDPLCCFELAVMVPLARLLTPRGLYLLPTISVEKESRGMLILSPFSLERELVALRKLGHRIIGQRWTAVLEQHGRLQLMHLPGRVERTLPRHPSRHFQSQPEWRDLAPTGSVSSRRRATCDRVVVVEHGRRLHAALQDIPMTRAGEALRRLWPLRWPSAAAMAGPLFRALARHASFQQLQVCEDPAQSVLALCGQAIPAKTPSQSTDAERDLSRRPTPPLAVSPGLARVRRPSSRAAAVNRASRWLTAGRSF